MAIPRNVARQGERAETIRKKVYEEGKTPKELGVKTQLPPGEAPPIEPDPPIPPGDEIEPEVILPAEDYKQKYEDAVHQISVLKGKIDTEVPDLVSINRMQAGQIAELQSSFSDLQARMNKPAEEPTVTRPDPEEVKDLQTYKDMYPEIHRGQLIVMKEWVKSDEFKGMVSSVVGEVFKGTVEPRVASVEKDIKKGAEDTFASRLDRLVTDENGKPCWKPINDDPEFTKYLKNKKYRGVSDFELLRNAVTNGDVDTVAEFFNDYIAFKKPATPPPPKPKPGDGPAVGDEEIAPARPGSGTPPKKPGEGDGKPKTFTRSFVKKYHTDVALGRYKNKPKDRERIKAEIDEAMAKGLIVDG